MRDLFLEESRNDPTAAAADPLVLSAFCLDFLVVAEVTTWRATRTSQSFQPPALLVDYA